MDGSLTEIGYLSLFLSLSLLIFLSCSKSLFLALYISLSLFHLLLHIYGRSYPCFNEPFPNSHVKCILIIQPKIFITFHNSLSQNKNTIIYWVFPKNVYDRVCSLLQIINYLFLLYSFSLPVQFLYKTIFFQTL